MTEDERLRQAIRDRLVGGMGSVYVNDAEFHASVEATAAMLFGIVCDTAKRVQTGHDARRLAATSEQPTWSGF